MIGIYKNTKAGFTLGLAIKKEGKAGWSKARWISEPASLLG
jgi:hypothetical protein